MLRRAGAIVAVVAAAFVLSACFVVSTVPPKTTGFDQRLIGFWEGLSDGKPTGTILQFVEGTDKKEPRMIAAHARGIAVYDLRTLKAGARGGAFAARVMMSDDPDDNIPDGYLLGLYEIRGNTLWISILNSADVGALVDAGKVKGVKTKGAFFDVTLTGTPEEIAAFLASPDARTSIGEGTILARRMAPPR